MNKPQMSPPTDLQESVTQLYHDLTLARSRNQDLQPIDIQWQELWDLVLSEPESLNITDGVSLALFGWSRLMSTENYQQASLLLEVVLAHPRTCACDPVSLQSVRASYGVGLLMDGQIEKGCEVVGRMLDESVSTKEKMPAIQVRHELTSYIYHQPPTGIAQTWLVELLSRTQRILRPKTFKPIIRSEITYYQLLKSLGVEFDANSYKPPP